MGKKKMMKGSGRSLVFGLALMAFVSSAAFAQDPSTYRDVFATGLKLESSLGSVALRDEFISRERYSGTLPSFGLGWARFHGTAAFHLALEIERSSAVRNYNVSATITEFSLRQGFLYPVTTFGLLSKDAFLLLGPVAELFVFVNEQHLAVDNPNFAVSTAGQVLLGLDSRLVTPLGHGFQTELAARMGVVSLGFRTVDTEVNDVSPVKILTPLSGLNGDARLGLRFRPDRYLSVVLSARLHVFRVHAWDQLVAVNDGVILGLSVG